jgi:hypothetical protein
MLFIFVNVLFFIGVAAAAALFFFLIQVIKKRKQYDENTAFVVVLGDIGRSPRMNYHSLSLSDSLNLNVKLIGYSGRQFLISCIKKTVTLSSALNIAFFKESKLMDSILSNQKIEIVPLKTFPKLLTSNRNLDSERLVVLIVTNLR